MARPESHFTNIVFQRHVVCELFMIGSVNTVPVTLRYQSRLHTQHKKHRGTLIEIGDAVSGLTPFPVRGYITSPFK
jgi:hypothetical protein